MTSLQKETRKELWNEIIEIMNKVKGMRNSRSDEIVGARLTQEGCHT